MDIDRNGPFFHSSLSPLMDKNWNPEALFRGAWNKLQGSRFASPENLPMKNTHNGTPMQEQAQTGESAAMICPGETTHDGIDRRNFLSCMAWAETGLFVARPQERRDPIAFLGVAK